MNSNTFIVNACGVFSPDSRTLVLSLYPTETAGQVTVTPLAGGTYTGGLFWDCNNDVLLYMEKSLNEIHRLDVITNQEQQIQLDQFTSFVITTQGYNRSFIISQGNDIIYLFWPYDSESDYYAECLIATVDHYCPGVIFNDARADGNGRVWSGTTFPLPDLRGSCPSNQGSLYRIDTTKSGKADISAVLRPVSYINDLTWTVDNRLFYFSESYSDCIYSFTYDLQNGVICNGHSVFCFSDFDITGQPQGISLDRDGNLWIAANGAGLVLSINPTTQQLLRTVAVPATSVVDVEFGGPQLDILYVATRNVGDPLEPLAGSIFQVTGLDTVSFCEHQAVMNSDCTPEFFN